MIDRTVAAAAELVLSTPDGSPADIDVEDLALRVAAYVEAGEVPAQRHPIGFLHIDMSELGGAPPGVNYRLHLWTEISPRVDGLGTIHDHVWALASAVLIGDLEDVNFVARASSNGRDAFVLVSYTPQGNDFVPAGTYEVAEARRRAVAAPMVYRLDAGRLHRTEVLSLPTMTLVVADRRVAGPDRPLVSVAAEAAPEHVGTRPIISPRDAADMLRGVLGERRGHGY
jgi:hypothetical protein